MKIKIAVTGYKGRLGQRLVALGALPLDCDVLDVASVDNAIKSMSPDVIIHAAAKSGVDFCQNNYNKAFDVNAYGTNNVSVTASGYNAKILYLSSEQVFSGVWGKYKETNKIKPKNTYGLTKQLGESLAGLWGGKTLRLSRGVSRTDTDIDGVLDCMKNDKEKITVPSFFYRNYQHVDFLSEQIWWCANRFDILPSILHVGGSEYLSWHDFVTRLAKADGYNGKIAKRKVDRKEFAPRPHRCGFNLSLARSIGVPMYKVQTTIERLLSE